MRGAAAVWRGAAYVGGHGVGGALVQRVPGQHVPVIVVSSLDELHCTADVRCGAADVDGHGVGGALVQRVPGQHVPVVVVSSLDELHCAANV
jgi:hypothetical protein